MLIKSRKMNMGLPQYNGRPQYGNSLPTTGVQCNMTAADIAFRLSAQVDTEFYDALYPDREWPLIVDDSQIYTDINAGATSYAYMTRNRYGAAAFIGNGPNNDIPMVGQSMGAVEVPIAYAAVGAQVTNEDAREYAFGVNGNLAQDMGGSMREACDNLIERSVIFGVPDLQFHGWINYPGIRVITPTASAADPTSTAWDKKNGLEIVGDINSALTAVWQDSRTIFKPLDIFLPLRQYGLITSMPMTLGTVGGSGGGAVPLLTNVIDYAARNNIMYRTTGQELRIYPCRYLDGAGIGGTDRMVIMDRSDRNQIFPFPLPYTLSEPQPKELSMVWYAEMKFGSYHVRQAGSMAYVDGI